MLDSLLPLADTFHTVSDTLHTVTDTIVQPEVIEQMTHSSSSAGKTGLTIAILGFLVFAAHLFSEIFSRKRVPDVLLLMIIGLIIGPVFHWVRPSSFGAVGGIFSAVTLVVILFESGTQLGFESLLNSLRGTVRLTMTNFFTTMVVVGLIGWLALKIDPLTSFMLGSIIGGTSSAVVIPMIKQLKISEKGGTILILESAFGSVLCIVFALALLQAVQIGKLNFGIIFGQIFASFVLTTIFGLLAAVFWSYILDKMRHVKNSILTTPAFVFIVYGFNEFIGFSGAIAALAFGIGLANIDSIYDGLLNRVFKSRPAKLNPTEKLLFSEVSFLLKTFFFVYIGISIRLDQYMPILIGLGLTIVLFTLRILIVRFAISKRKEALPANDMVYMATMLPKGLAAAVLATIPAQAGIPGGENIQNIVFAIILFTTIFTSVLVPIIEGKNLISKLYLFIFRNKESILETADVASSEMEASSLGRRNKKHFGRKEEKEQVFDSEIVAESMEDNIDRGSCE
ncbi:MAG: cation:proton antiporter [Candidatus Limimorpha sp.]